MSEVSAEMLADLLTHIQNGGNFMSFIRENDLNGTVRVRDLRSQFVDYFGSETLRSAMKDSIAPRISQRLTNMAQNMQDTNKIDELITSLNNVVQTLQTRKEELSNS